MRRYSRGKYVRRIVNNYTVIDIETTGLSYDDDEIIEIALLKVRNSKIINKYQQLLDPQTSISSFITNLTGINSRMVQNQPLLEDIYDDVMSFIGRDLIVGHNTSFDLNFIANKFQIDLKNEYVDTVQFSKRVFPELSHYRLSDMVDYLDLSSNEHRALADCQATYELYEYCKKMMMSGTKSF